MSITKLDASLQTLFNGPENAPTPLRGNRLEPVLIYFETEAAAANTDPNNVLPDGIIEEAEFGFDGKRVMAMVRRRNLLRLAGHATVVGVVSLAAVMLPSRADMPDINVRPQDILDAGQVPGTAAWACTGVNATGNRVTSVNGFVPNARTGAGVYIGVIDATLDAANPAFWTQGSGGSTSRIAAMWSQHRTGTAAQRPTAALLAKGANAGAAGFAPYGVEHNSAEINQHAANYDGTAKPTNLSSMPEAAHGTHVACIAAGFGADGPVSSTPTNRKDAFGDTIYGFEFAGAAPQAALIGVRPDLSKGYIGLVHAVRYIVHKARALSGDPTTPVVINMSLGVLAGPRCQQSPVTDFFDAFLDQEFPTGVVFVTSAGNHRNWNLHALATIPATGNTTVSLAFADVRTVPTVGTLPQVSLRAFVYYQLTAAMLADPNAVSVQVPGATAGSLRPPVNSVGHLPRRFVVPGGRIRAAVGTGDAFAPKAAPQVGDWRCFVIRYRAARSSTQLSGTTRFQINAPAGTQMRIFTSGTNSYKISPVASADVALITDSQITEIAACKNVITVAGVDVDPLNPTATAPARLNATPADMRAYRQSALGPLIRYAGQPVQTQKPDVSAPGVNIEAAVPQTYQGSLIGILRLLRQIQMRVASMSGTSMAAPAVAGIIALMMQERRGLSVAEVRTELQKAANTFQPVARPGHALPAGAAYTNTFGTGVIDAKMALDVARALNAPA